MVLEGVSLAAFMSCGSRICAFPHASAHRARRGEIKDYRCEDAKEKKSTMDLHEGAPAL